VGVLRELDTLLNFKNEVSEGEFDFSKPEIIDSVFKLAEAALAEEVEDAS
jgi:hypothetical protein